MNTFFDVSRNKLAEVMGGLPDVFTPEWLDTANKKLSTMISVGGIEGSIAYWAKQQCWVCGFYMRVASVREAHFMGPLRANPFRAGETVTIPAGCKVLRGHELVETKRPTRVTISAIREGRTDTLHGRPVAYSPVIVWKSGSTRCELDLGRNPLPVSAANEQLQLAAA